MDAKQFDRLTRMMTAHKVNRRQAVQGLAGGLAAIGLWQTSAAQDATPVAQPADRPMTLFVQTAAAGTFGPNDAPGAGVGTHLLTLTGHPGQTISFADRPARNFGQVNTASFLDALGFTPANPPNAALVAQTATDERDVLILELLNPSYDNEANILIYEANILGAYSGEGLAPVAAGIDDLEISPAFETPSLFVDDCPDAEPLNCYYQDPNAGDPLVGNLGDQGMCWSWYWSQCLPCQGADTANAECNNQFPECQGNCWAGYNRIF